MTAAILFFVFVYDEIEWGRHVRIAVGFEHTGGLREGAPLVAGGRTVGVVETIGLDRRDGIVVRVAIPLRYARRITRGGDVFVASRGPLGERYLEIGPAPAAGPSLAEDPSPLTGRDPPTLDRVLQRTWDNLEVTRRFAEHVRPELDVLRANIAELATALEGLAPDVGGLAGLGLELSALVAEARELRDQGLGGDAGLAKLDAVIDRTRATIARARGVLDELGAKARTLARDTDALRARLGTKGPQAIAAAERAIERMRAALDKIDPLLAKVGELQARIARGEGSLGRLMKDPEFPEDAKELGKILKRQPWKVIQRPKD